MTNVNGATVIRMNAGQVSVQINEAARHEVAEQELIGACLVGDFPDTAGLGV